MPKTVILLALYNGADHLPAQIDSFLAQQETDWMLIVSDDGSNDAGPSIVRDYARKQPVGRITLIDGPRAGAAANFLHLLAHVPDDVPYACFSDQDDVWLPHKLTRALGALTAAPTDLPVVYCSSTLITDADLQHPRLSPTPAKLPSFRNALVQNIVAGNTAVVNPAALRILKQAQSGARAVVMHDWWIYQMVTGAGGQVIWDQEPGLFYRQHPNNVVGSNDSNGALLRRFTLALQGSYRDWNDRNVDALLAAQHLLTPQNRDLLHRFIRARASWLPRRLWLLWQTGVYLSLIHI